jgi:hypothetical protein
MLKQTMFAFMGLVFFSQTAWSLPGEKTKRMEQILKHHAFFPSSNFGVEIGEVGPIKNFRSLTENRLLYFAAYYNVHDDGAESIQYEQVSVINSSAEENCSFVLDMEGYYSGYLSDLSFTELLKQCTEGANVDFHRKDSKSIKALELSYGTSSPVIGDFKSSKLVKEAWQHFYRQYDSQIQQHARRLISGEPIPFAVFKGVKYTYVASPNSLMIVKPSFSFSQMYANWTKDDQLYKQIQADQLKQKPYEL